MLNFNFTDPEQWKSRSDHFNVTGRCRGVIENDVYLVEAKSVNENPWQGQPEITPGKYNVITQRYCLKDLQPQHQLLTKLLGVITDTFTPNICPYNEIPQNRLEKTDFPLQCRSPLQWA